jgi:tetratricopeptide (TPR) repeat protein
MLHTKNTLQITLINSFILLITMSLNVFAENISDKISACNQALEKGDFKTSLNVANDILKLESNNRAGFLCKGRALGAEGNYKEGLNALELAAKNSQPGLDEIIAYIFIGNLHKKNKQYSEAIASYDKSLNLSRASKNDKFVRINHNFIGDTHTSNNDLNAALTSYLAGSKLAMNDNERAESFGLIAATYSTLKQNDLALEYQVKATLMQEKSGTLDEYANASYVLGKSYLAANDYNNAERIFAKLQKFSKDNGGAYYEAKASYGLAQVKLALNEKDLAKDMLNEALKIAKILGEDELATEIDASLKGLSN